VKWLWVCSGDPDSHRIVFSVVKCTKSRTLACATLLNLKRKEPRYDHWIRKDVEHYDRDYKQFKCPECENEMSNNELSATWDWAGPHCNACGCTGMSMFSAVTLNPIMSGYQGVKSKFASVLGWDTIDEIDRKERVKKEGC
jgi:ribosomal protein L37AE/L43A